jgi:hypothetical protein
MDSPTPTLPASADRLSTGGIATTPQRRKLKRSTRIALVVILIVAVIAGVGVAVSYFLSARNYVSTDNSQIDGDKIVINTPASGTLGTGASVRAAWCIKARSWAVSRFKTRLPNRS